tara:strand:+ start:267 stop:731 length:465 start_codon:yes stop_codon:yes gene_type:complete
MCVFGELFYDSFIPGLCCGLIFLIICFSKTSNKKNFILTVLSISTIGYLFDSVLILLQIYNFETSYYFGFLPLWMLILWPSFATLFDEVFRFLSQYKILAVLLSSILGPLTYFSGEILGLIIINNIFLFFILMIIFWAALMIFYLSFIVKLKLN